MKRNAKNVFQKITANVSGLIRNDAMVGKDYTVVPMIMMVEGVHEGSSGPIYYSPEELGKTPEMWNHKPVVVYHPQHNGTPISACDPVVLTKSKVGVIMNTHFDDGKLKAEAWLEPDRIDLVDNRIAKALEKQAMMEVSVGVFTDNMYVEEGKWNDEEYEWAAVNCRPDHLAILPDLKGACSIADGAGLLRLNQAEESTQLVLNLERLGEEEITFAKENMGGLSARFSNLLAEQVLKANEKSHNEIYRELADLLQAKQADAWLVDVFDSYIIYDLAGGDYYKQEYMKDDKGKLMLVGPSQKVTKKVTYEPVKLSDMQEKEEEEATHVLDANSVWKRSYINDLPDNAFLYVASGKRQFPIRNAEGNIDVPHLENAIARIPQSNLPKAVKDTLLSNAETMLANVKQKEQGKESTMNKDELVKSLIENESTAWAEGDKEVLMGMDEAVLQKMVPVVVNEEVEETIEEETPVETPVVNKNEEPAPKKKPSVASYLSEMPPEVKDVFEEGLASREADRTRLIKTITANERNILTEADLRKKPTSELKAIAQLAAPEHKDETVYGYNYSGQGDYVVANEEEEKPLGLPEWK